jgi:hypothetical protein
MDRLLDDALRPGALRIEPFRISLADAGVTLAEVLAHPRVGRLHSLELGKQDLPPSAVDTLLAWPGLSRVRCLAIHLNELGAPGVLRLLRSPQLQQLRWLETQAAEGRSGGDEDAVRFVEELALRTPLPHLRFIRFGAHGAGAGAGHAVGRLASFPRLTTLSYCLAFGSGNDIVAGLVEASRLAALRCLALDGTGIDDDALRLLLRSGKTHALKALMLRMNNLSSDGYQALADARGALPALEQLTASSWVGDGATLPVLAGMDVPRLRWLDLFCARGDGVLDAFVQAPFVPQLRGLRLHCVALEVDEVRRFLASPRLAAIRRLRLDGLRLDGDDLALFRAQPRVLDGVLAQWFTDTRDREAS